MKDKISKVELENILRNFKFLVPSSDPWYAQSTDFYIKGTRFKIVIGIRWDRSQLQYSNYEVMCYLREKYTGIFHRVSFSEILSSKAVKNKYKVELLYFLDIFN